MINVIIFSLDRAAQLELLIKSMKKFFKEFSSTQIKILYKYSNESFEKGYEQLKTIHNDSNILYFKEDGFQKSLMSLFDIKQKYSVFFVDDNVFKEPFSLEDEHFRYFSSHNDILTLSLRLHPKLTYCYPASVDMTAPGFLNEYNVFDWRGKSGDYGYPMSLDGHIFRTMDIYFYITGMKYGGPNPLESQMASMPISIPKMMCYNKSIIFNNPINKVQNFNNNVHGNIKADFLNEQFLSGKVIDLTPLEGLENISCHQETPINFI